MTARTLTPEVDFEYDPKSKRFKYVRGSGKGQFVSKNAVIATLQRGISESINVMFGAVSSLFGSNSNSRIDLDEFILTQADELKKIHILQATVAKEGRADLITDTDRKNISKRLKEQFTSGKDPDSGKRFGLKFLLQDIIKDNPSEAEIANRIKLFTESGKISFNESEREYKKNQGQTEGRRQLGENDNHCPECVRYAGLGWQDISKLIMPTQQCRCKNNCKCTVIYR